MITRKGTEMIVVITMAGLGLRFRKAGYTIPKYVIEVKGKTLFEWSMESLTDYNRQPDVKYVFVVRKDDDARDFIEEKFAKFGVDDFEIVEIEQLTDGQATSALMAKRYWREDDELVIYNIDTYIESDTLKYKDVTGDGYIPCFNAPGEHWSFVKLDEKGVAVEVREKQRISDNCTVGLYYFKSCRLYEELYNEYYSDGEHMEKNEKFVAPLYNYMIEKGMEVRISIVPYNKVHVLGTPEEVEVFRGCEVG